MVNSHILEVLEREEKAQKDAERRLADINRKRTVEHLLYPWLKVDRRTTKEVQESRKLKAFPPLDRRSRKARQNGKKFKVTRDKDGAFRLLDRLDGETKAFTLS